MPDSVDAPAICMVATLPEAFTHFMAPHIRVLQHTHRITLVTNGSSDVLDALCGDQVSVHSVAIARDISLVSDALALLALWKLFRRERFLIVQSMTPKAGFLAMVAARLAGISTRVHWFTGQVWATQRGLSRWLLKTLDRILAACSTHLLADSASQAAFLAREGVVRDGEVSVLARGSVCGVDTDRFRPDPVARTDVRTRLDIPDHAVVALYLGRLKREKGLPELAMAFAKAAAECAQLYLVIVGRDEENLQESLIGLLGSASTRTRFVPAYTTRPEAFMAASDIFVLPSHREGFGAVVIEAASCGVPTIGTRIYGLSDAVREGKTGILVPVGDVRGLRDALVSLTCDDRLRASMGAEARLTVQQFFTHAHLTKALRAYYDTVLATSAATR